MPETVIDKMGHRLCGAGLRKRPGKVCRQKAMENGRCKLHGGLSTGRPITSGRYSGRLGRFREAYEEALGNKSLLDLREPMALIEVAAQKAAERANDADTPEFRSRMIEHLRALKLQAGFGGKELDDALALAEQGVADDKALEHLVGMAERLARRVEEAWKISLAKQSVINARDLTVILTRLADIVTAEAPGETSARILRRFDAELLPRGPVQARTIEAKAG